MEYISKPKTSLFNFSVLFSLIVLVVTLLAFMTTTSKHLTGAGEARLGPYKFFLLGASMISALTLLINGAKISKNNLFLWYAVFYVLVGVFSTFICGLYPAITLPFRFIRLSYWAWVLIISY